jgi:hypothetical protein
MGKKNQDGVKVRLLVHHRDAETGEVHPTNTVAMFDKDTAAALCGAGVGDSDPAAVEAGEASTEHKAHQAKLEKARKAEA